MIADVILTPLKQIHHPKGDVFHALKSSEISYQGFGEAYFSFVKKNEKKGWKKHLKMTMNLIVPIGTIRFLFYDDRPESSNKGNKAEIVLSKENYQRITVPPGLWMAFEGFDDQNMVLNIANIPHDPQESINLTEKELFVDS